jgi:hypothetical protein
LFDQQFLPEDKGQQVKLLLLGDFIISTIVFTLSVFKLHLILLHQINYPALKKQRLTVNIELLKQQTYKDNNQYSWRRMNAYKTISVFYK